jgi:hypothetical protein
MKIAAPTSSESSHFLHIALLELSIGTTAWRQLSNSNQSHAFDVSAADLGYGIFYYKGPQGDISRFYNIVRCVCDEI